MSTSAFSSSGLEESWLIISMLLKTSIICSLLPIMHCSSDSFHNCHNTTLLQLLQHNYSIFLNKWWVLWQQQGVSLYKKQSATLLDLQGNPSYIRMKDYSPLHVTERGGCALPVHSHSECNRCINISSSNFALDHLKTQKHSGMCNLYSKQL